MAVDDQFWVDEAELMYELVFPVAKAAVESATEQALKTLEVDFGIVFSAEAVNEGAVKLAEQLALDLVVGITDTSKKLFQQYSVEWIESGEPLDVLIGQLVPVFGAVRSEAIAVTEVTRIFALANNQAWAASGYVEEVEIRTSEDDLVCEICAPLGGTKVRVNGTGGFPPFHVRCRCWEIPVVRI